MSTPPAPVADPTITDWITALSSIITALGIILVVWQVVADHRRSRRERAIELLGEWAKHLSTGNNAYINIGFLLTPEQIGLLVRKEPILINQKQYEAVSTLLGVYDPNNKSDFILNLKQVTEIRFEIINYLNMLEHVLGARYHSIADRDIIKSQFISFYNADKEEAIFSEFRKESGGQKVYPIISDFELELRNDNAPKLKKQKRTPL